MTLEDWFDRVAQDNCYHTLERIDEMGRAENRRADELERRFEELRAEVKAALAKLEAKPQPKPKATVVRVQVEDENDKRVPGTTALDGAGNPLDKPKAKPSGPPPGSSVLFGRPNPDVPDFGPKKKED